VDRNSWPLGIRPADLATVAVVIAVIELNVTVGGGAGAAPLNAEAYILGAVITLPLLLRRRWPLQVLWVSFAAMILYYSLDRRNISPAPLMAVPVYDAALAGYLAWAIGLPALIMTLGLIVVGLSGSESTIVTLANFLPSFAIFILAVALGEVIRGRRALAAETARRLRLAEDERKSEAARLVAEERLRIARELHDTVAHSVATITVQASSALHVLSNPLSPNGSSRLPAPPPPPPDTDKLQDALLAIRETSKSALAEMRSVLGQLRGDPGAQPAADDGALGLSRLPELRDAITAAGSPVTVTVEGEQAVLPSAADHAAYRILQESLTNVLKHAAPGTPADVRLCYEPGQLTITVSNEAGQASAPGAGDANGNGTGRSVGAGWLGGNGRSVGAGWPGGNGRSVGAGWLGGNGIRGMRERTASVGGTLEAGPTPGGFAVTATVPRTAP
jgi:signal transduction histidine kinase